MQQVTRRLIAGPLVAFGVGLGDGVVGQAHFGDRHDNVRSVYRLGVLGLGALGLATNRWTEASLGAMSGAAALVGSRVIPAVRGGGWQQFGYVESAIPEGDPTQRPRQSTVDLPPDLPFGGAPPAIDGVPGQKFGTKATRWTGHARGYSVEQAPGLL